MKWLLFLYPWLELWSLIELGTQTSATSAMLWVFGAGVLGIGLFRLAGRQTLEHLQQAQREGVLSQQLLMGNVSRFVAGVLLIIPGLISDVLAVAVLIAPLRMLLAKLLVGGSINAQHNPYQGQGQGQVRESPSGSTLGLAIAALKMTGSLSRVSSNRCHLNKRAKIARHRRR